MKTSVYILTTIFALNIHLASANSHLSPLKESGSPKSEAALEINKLMPSTPKEADFSDIVPDAGLVSKSLSPVIHRVATFEDDYELNAANDPETLLKILAPVTPKEAGFDENIIEIPDPDKLSPSTPKEADFELIG